MSPLALFRHRLAPRVAAIGAVILLGVAAGFAWVASQHRAAQCRRNLSTLYDALVKYEQRTGALPAFTFFPDDVQLDPDSLYANLVPYGIQPNHCLCPSSPAPLRETGMSYLWNVSLNGRRIADLPVPRWMLVEANALSAAVPAPHRGRYNVLYTDGAIRTSRIPPPMP